MESIMESKLNEILSRTLLGNRKLINFKDCFIYDKYLHIADHIENFKVRDDDIWVCTFPKAGTTWMQEMVWNIVNDLDFKKAEIPIDRRFPYMEYPAVTIEEIPDDLIDESIKINNLDPGLMYIESLAKWPSPRFIKTHLPFQLLPRQLREGEKKCKMIYVSRNPKDTCISNFHFFSAAMHIDCTFEDYCKLFLGDKVLYAPFWKHLNSYSNRNDSNILYVKFEDMKKDLRSVIKKVAAFLGKKLNNEQLESLENHLSFANMKQNPAVKYEPVVTRKSAKKYKGSVAVEEKFMRSGEVGQWKTKMSQELIKQFDDWVRENSSR